MKTITEFSGILLQRAAEAQQAYRAAHPQVVTPAVEEAPPAPVAVAEGSTDVAVDPSATAAFVLTALNGLVAWFRPDGRLSPTDVADLYAHLAVRAVTDRDVADTTASPAAGPTA